ncbi:MAG: hypothetical protein RL077_3264 [Verrucomicrobiota bacterium]|jgi:predicted dehydrogenase
MVAAMNTPLVFRFLATLLMAGAAQAGDIRLGMVGLDTSHAVAFTKILHDPAAKDFIAGAKVVGAWKAASPDIKSSWSTVEGYTEKLRTEFGVKMYDSIEELVKNVDAVLIESVDGRPHLAQARAVILAGKPLFVDKPLAASLKDALAIFALAREHHVPIFSASSLRFAPETVAVRAGSIGRVLRAETSSPAHLEATHPDLFWYGIHGVEALFTVMGPGVESVTRRSSAAGAIEVEGRWADGRVGVFREGKTYAGKAVGEKGEASVGKYDGYAPLVKAIVAFLQTKVAPVAERETVEILAFMEADVLSKARGGAAVKISEVLARAGYLPSR